MVKSPLIGIVSKEVDIHFNNWTVDSTSNEIRYALTKNGARVISILPPQEKRFISSTEETPDLNAQEITALEKTLALCNGVVFQGGLKTFHYEKYIAQYTRQHNIPTLGICAGFNVMIQAAGGKTRLLEKPHKHWAPELKYVHTIQIDRQSLFYHIVKTPILRVNSIHNATLEKLSGYTSVGKTPDGLIEVIEDSNSLFNIGVHFHPELLIDEDKKMNAIFQAFVDAASTK